MGTVPLPKSLNVEQRRPTYKRNAAAVLMATELESSTPQGSELQEIISSSKGRQWKVSSEK